MNTSNQAVTLQTAILIQVKEFAKNQTTFSVHDITRTLREKVNKGELEIPEVEVSGASFHFDIPHKKVKQLFEESWKNGMFDPDFTLARQFNGNGYFEYTPTVSTGNVTTSIPPITPTVLKTTSSAPSRVKDRIELYLNSCKSKGVNPTLKQVQSAIKRGDEKVGLNCADIRAIIEVQLGHSITNVLECSSKQVVSLV